MPKEKTTAKNTSNTVKQVRKPKAVTLLVYLTDYLTDNDIGTDQSISAVVDKLEASIVDEAKAKMRS